MMKFKNGSSVSTDDFWYDLFEGGYIKPKKLLAKKEDIEKVEDAIKTLKEFKSSMEEEIGIEYR